MKNILSGLCILVVMLSFTIDKGGVAGENGTLSVNATWSDAYKASVHPDSGCEMFVINEADLMYIKYGDLKNVVEMFQDNKYDYLLNIRNSMDPARNNTLRNKFDTLSVFTCKYINGFRKLPAIVRGQTDETGHAAISLKPGKYYILFVSGSVKSDNNAESKGNIGYKIVDIKSGDETIQNVCFQKYEVTGIMIPRNPSGC